MGDTNITRNTINNYFSLTINNQTVNQSCGADAVNRSLNLFNSINDRLDFGPSRGNGFLPQAGCMPSPSIGQSSAPAGEGLKVSGEGGWPANTVVDAAGYRIVAEGNTNWSIYAPGQKPGDTPHTRVWGDPHVTEKDGTRWDFTKDGDFVLPSGTRIFADTDYDAAKGNGQSVTKRLVIANGADKLEIDNVDKNPTLGNITQDGYEWRALHLTNPRAAGDNKYGQAEGEHDSFHLRGDQENVHWMRERNGQLDGVVKDSKQIDAGGHKVYEQNVDPTLNPTVAREMRAPIGSRAWGNQVRSELNDAQARFYGQVFGKDLGALGALQNSYGIHSDHINGQFRADVMDWMFGGLPGYFNNYNSGPWNALSDMIQLLRSDTDWRQQFRSTQYDRSFS